MAAQLLLVDDEPGLRDAVQAYLEESGYTVTVASNAKDGFALAQQHLPDLVISDVMMPQVDGYQFLKQLRDDPRFATLPVIFLTARGMTADRIQGYNAGCDAYLPKPFDPDELVAIVGSLLKNREATKTSAAGDDAQSLAEMARQIAEIRAVVMQGGAGGIAIKSTTSLQLDLTPREQDVLRLVVEGLMNKEIARRLETSVRNVEKYVSRLFNKTGTNSRTELVRFALEHGLVQ